MKKWNCLIFSENLYTIHNKQYIHSKIYSMPRQHLTKLHGPMNSTVTSTKYHSNLVYTFEILLGECCSSDSVDPYSVSVSASKTRSACGCRRDWFDKCRRVVGWIAVHSDDGWACCRTCAAFGCCSGIGHTWKCDYAKWREPLDNNDTNHGE